MILTSFLMAALLAAAQPVTTLTLGDAKNMPAKELARRLLPPDVAPRIVEGGVDRVWLLGQVHSARFSERAIAAGAMLCRQRVHTVRLSNPGAAGHPDDPAVVLDVGPAEIRNGYATTFPQRAGAKSCAQIKSLVFPTEQSRERTIAAIEQLTTAMAAARSRHPLPFALDCKEDEGGDACLDARLALANLPLKSLFGVSFDTNSYVTDSIIPAADGKTMVRVRRMVPSPDGSPPTPTFEFGNSGPDGRSWRVTFIGENGTLKRVAMRRSVIIYH